MSIILKVGAQSMRVSNLTVAAAIDIAVTLAGSNVQVILEPSPVAKVDRGAQG